MNAKEALRAVILKDLTVMAYHFFTVEGMPVYIFEEVMSELNFGQQMHMCHNFRNENAKYFSGSTVR